VKRRSGRNMDEIPIPQTFDFSTPPEATRTEKVVSGVESVAGSIAHAASSAATTVKEAIFGKPEVKAGAVKYEAHLKE
jgi:hypothetical protein